ncbi:hypothetical protein HII36_27785 [Nonomuraea sp. NN258]|uniref:hypothetical protein n=1 Tax=Nonomuraea antri TaxID=2730852 RepID=UPI00156846E3|nr:hypothetical protein [Nonomuraea antri]NRQ35606.1 hypothetical protein [Nonomuraea antri]
MSRLGPVITLAAGVVLAAGLGVASVTAAPAAEQAAASEAVEPSATPPGNANASESTGESASANPSPEQSAAAQPVVKADYGGRVKGNGGLIAISIRDGKAVGYFCDGRTEAWFKGAETGGKLELKGLGGATIGATLTGGTAKGKLTVGGGKWTFVAPTVVKPSGLYRATALVRGAKLRAGWIVIKRPQGGYDQVGAAFLDERQLDIPRLDDESPTAPVTVEQTTLHPKDVDGFIQEMR